MYKNKREEKSRNQELKDYGTASKSAMLVNADGKRDGELISVLQGELFRQR